MAPAEDDISIDEKRVYAARAGRTDAYVATDLGVVRVAISGDTVGEFELAIRGPARDVAVLDRPAGSGLLAVAADDRLRIGRIADSAREVDTVEVPGVDAPVAVGVRDGAFLVASETGAVTRVRVDDGSDTGCAERAVTTDGAIETTVQRLGTVAGPRAVDGSLIAGEDGVHRVVDGYDGGRVESVGLRDVRDVAGSGVPLAATSEGLYWLGNGWMDALDGPFDAVAADGDGHAMAVGAGTLFVHANANGPDGVDTDPDGVDDHPDAAGGEAGEPDDGAAGSGDEAVRGWNAEAWDESTLPIDDPPVALEYGPGVSVAVTEAGTVCVDDGDGWRHRSVGVRGVEAVALATVDTS